MKSNRYKLLMIAIFACLALSHADIVTVQTVKEQEINRIFKRLIDAENKHDVFL